MAKKEKSYISQLFYDTKDSFMHHNKKESIRKWIVMIYQ